MGKSHVGRRWAILLAVVALLLGQHGVRAGEPVPCVILLHGLTKDADSMQPLAERLTAAGFLAVNVEFSSRQAGIPELAGPTVGAGLAQCHAANAQPINFVTHSLGGILLRYYYENRPGEGVHRVVMMGPPNNGSRIGDWLDHIPWIKDVNGPSGRQLGTGPTSVPLQLGPAPFELGVIAGSRSRNPVASAILRGKDDGRITVESARLEGMCGFKTLPLTHGEIMADPEAIRQALLFLQRGHFTGATAEAFDCGF